jgi:hypothetical protein
LSTIIIKDYFEQQLRPIVSQINKTMVCWEELFDDNVALDRNTIVQVWKNHDELQAVHLKTQPRIKEKKKKLVVLKKMKRIQQYKICY